MSTLLSFSYCFNESHVNLLRGKALVHETANPSQHDLKNVCSHFYPVHNMQVMGNMTPG